MKLLKILLVGSILSCPLTAVEQENLTAAAIMEESCSDCHNAKKQKGDFDLAYLGQTVTKENAALWHDAMDQVATEEMPPKEELSKVNRETLIAFFKEKIDTYLNKSVAKVVPETRRLTLKEYANSIKDLLEIPYLGTNSPLNDLTEDAYNHGFNNISKDLIMSSFHLNGYINTTRKVLDGVILDNVEQPETKTYELKSTDLLVEDKRILNVQPNLEKYIRILSSQSVVNFKNFSEFKQTGYYRITINAAGMDREYPYSEEEIGVHKCDPITLGIQLGSLEVSQDLPDNTPKPIVIEKWINAGTTFGLTYKTDGLRMKGNGNFKFNSGIQNKHLAKKLDWKVERSFVHWRGPRIHIHDVKIEGPFYKDWPAAREQNLIGANPQSEDLAKIITSFAEKAYRRPLIPNEVDEIIVYAQNLAESIGVKAAIKEGMTAILTSSSFLYMNRGKSYTAYDLASKMSYTLWSSKPDQELIDLATKGELDKGDTISAQINRMLTGRKNVKHFTQNFANAWLELNKLGFMPPEPSQFFYWNRKSVGHDMKREAVTFLREGIANNIPITEFLSADYSYINQDLAKIYGVEGIKGERLRKHTFKDGRRGGILGMGAFLVSTADGVATNPILRGVWIKRNILGSEPAPPPADIMIEEPDTSKAKTIRELLALHNTEENCKSCHAKIDPWGWAFENFDPSGAWRNDYVEYERDKKGNAKKDQNVTIIANVDASSELNNGDSYKDIHGFKKVLLKRDDEIVRSFIDKFITYMNGVKPDMHMGPEIDKILEKSKGSDYRIVDTIIHIFQSPVAYRNRQLVAN